MGLLSFVFVRLIIWWVLSISDVNMALSTYLFRKLQTWVSKLSVLFGWKLDKIMEFLLEYCSRSSCFLLTLFRSWEMVSTLSVYWRSLSDHLSDLDARSAPTFGPETVSGTRFREDSTCSSIFFWMLGTANRCSNKSIEQTLIFTQATE